MDIEIKPVTAASKPSEILTAAYALLQQPGVRIKRQYAVDSCGAHMYGCDPRARQFCAYGALQKVLGSSNDDHDATEFLRGASRRLFQSGPVCVNDDHPDEDFHAMWQAAIADAKEAEAEHV